MIDLYPTAPGKNLVVVRLKRSYWSDDKCLHLRTDLNFLKRKCKGENWLVKEALNIGPEEVIPLIKNLAECKDGVYIVVPEGDDEEWDYRLVPHLG